MTNETKGTTRSLVEDLEGILQDPEPVAENDEDPEARSGGTGAGTLISTVKPSLNPLTYGKRLLKKNLKMGSVVAPLVAPGAGGKAAGVATKVAGGINDESVSAPENTLDEEPVPPKDPKDPKAAKEPGLFDPVKFSWNPLTVMKRGLKKNLNIGAKVAPLVAPGAGSAAAGAATQVSGQLGDAREPESGNVLDERKRKANAALHTPDTKAGGKASSPHEPDTEAGGSPGKAKSGKELEKKAREKRKSKKAAGGRNPFKTKAKLGPGPRGGTNSQTRRWKCSCRTPYKCNCRAGKLTKVITIGRNYKKSYNKQYKQWRKGQRS